MKKKGRIQVTVQREDRLKAIGDLAEAIKIVAKALDCPTHVYISHCTLRDIKGGFGIGIDTEEDVTRTEIKEMED